MILPLHLFLVRRQREKAVDRVGSPAPRLWEFSRRSESQSGATDRLEYMLALAEVPEKHGVCADACQTEEELETWLCS